MALNTSAFRAETCNVPHEARAPENEQVGGKPHACSGFRHDLGLRFRVLHPTVVYILNSQDL